MMDIFKGKNNCKGYTLTELMIAAGIASILSLGCIAMFIAASKSFDATTAQSYSDFDAVIAIQKIVNDVREAKNFSIIADGKRLRLVFPKMLDIGYYNRREPDTANQIEYYLSDETGLPGRTGTYLWRGKSDGSRTRVAKNISSLSFQTDTTRSVKITVVATNPSSHGPKSTRLTERVVYLRNY
jgi:prepilin-type N-terminal cleavage/methylation domain-containing protein